jgi:hypothetical protein
MTRSVLTRDSKLTPRSPQQLEAPGTSRDGNVWARPTDGSGGRTEATGNPEGERSLPKAQKAPGANQRTPRATTRSRGGEQPLLRSAGRGRTPTREEAGPEYQVPSFTNNVVLTTNPKSKRATASTHSGLCPTRQRVYSRVRPPSTSNRKGEGARESEKGRPGGETKAAIATHAKPALRCLPAPPLRQREHRLSSTFFLHGTLLHCLARPLASCSAFNR